MAAYRAAESASGASSDTTMPTTKDSGIVTIAGFLSGKIAVA